MPITAPASPPKGRTRVTTKTATGNTVAPAPPPLSKIAGERSQGLQGWAQILSIGCVAKGWYADAGAIGMHAENICDETARIADHDDKIAKGLDWLMMTGPYAALAGAVLPLALQLLVNHDRMNAPMGMDGVVPKQALEAKVKAQVAKMQAEALKAQQEAEQELAEVQASMNGDGS
jgi:hypothetical protein